MIVGCPEGWRDGCPVGAVEGSLVGKEDEGIDDVGKPVGNASEHCNVAPDPDNVVNVQAHEVGDSAVTGDVAVELLWAGHTLHKLPFQYSSVSQGETVSMIQNNE